jgi:hypothetical protein
MPRRLISASFDIAASLLLAAMLTPPALAQNTGDEEDNTRGVRIIDAPTAAPTPPVAPSLAPALAAPAPSLTPAPAVAAAPPFAAIPPTAAEPPATPASLPLGPAVSPAPEQAPALVRPVPVPASAAIAPAPVTAPRPVTPALLTPAPNPPATLTPAPNYGVPVLPPVADAPAVAVNPPPNYAPASASTSGPFDLPRNNLVAPPLNNRPAPPPNNRPAPPGNNQIGGIIVRPTDTVPQPPPDDLAALTNSVKVANPAEVSVEILPGAQISMGARVSFRISSKKQGYLILVDVDATGKLTQIFPNPLSLLRGGNKTANLIRPGRPLQIPNPADVLAGFEFIASPPAGTAMVVAILSDRPLQLIDLPDLAPTMTGQPAAAEYLAKFASELRIPDDNGRLLETRWSFDAKFYAIR